MLTLSELMDTFRGVGNRAVAIVDGVNALEKQLASLKTAAESLTAFSTELGLMPPKPRALPVVSQPTKALADSELRLFTLLQTPNYTPGPKLADVLGISKRSIQSRIADLRRKGIKIDSINDPVKSLYGYKLSEGVVQNVEPKKKVSTTKVPAAKKPKVKANRAGVGLGSKRARPRGIRRAIRVAAVESAASAALDLFLSAGEDFLSWRKISRAIRPFLQDTHSHSYSMVTHIIAYLRRTNDIESARQARRRGVDLSLAVKGYRLVPEQKKQEPQQEELGLEEAREIAGEVA